MQRTVIEIDTMTELHLGLVHRQPATQQPGRARSDRGDIAKLVHDIA